MFVPFAPAGIMCGELAPGPVGVAAGESASTEAVRGDTDRQVRQCGPVSVTLHLQALIHRVLSLAGEWWLSFPHIMEVQVGTYTQQEDAKQVVVDQVAEFGLQISLAIPADKNSNWRATQYDADSKENIQRLRR